MNILVASHLGRYLYLKSETSAGVYHRGTITRTQRTSQNAHVIIGKSSPDTSQLTNGGQDIRVKIGLLDIKMRTLRERRKEGLLRRNRTTSLEEKYKFVKLRPPLALT
jgi:hypothetical protein